MAGNPVAENAIPGNPVSASVPYAIKALSPESHSDSASAVTAREILAVLLGVALADVTLYRGAGFAGIALFLGVVPLLLLMGSPRPSLRGSFCVVVVLVALLAIRMVWLGSVFAVLIGAVLLIAYSLVLQGVRPYASDVLARALETTVAGGFALGQYARSMAGFAPRIPRLFWLNVLLPLFVLVLFGMLFMLANPDLVTSFSHAVEWLFRQLQDWSQQLSQNAVELLVWLVAAWVGAGLVRPLRLSFSATTRRSAEPTRQPASSIWYLAIRNMLLAVIGLFAIYLVFEFATLWFRKFPQGFYYAGYAHQGAAWLTAALALATLVLSLIFRGDLLRDPRVGRLRILAWIWSAENLVLALTVYNRMYIYIDFNGMTRMRMIGLFGISTVVIGFALVIWKIIHNRDFVWLIQRQLWALAGAVYLFVLMPVDVIVHSYNVRQVLAGDLAPSVQISVHPISAEGYLVLRPLLDCDDAIIRDGVRAMLAERYLQERELVQERQQLGWTTWQLGDQMLLGRLEHTRDQWKTYLNDEQRKAALAQFRKYAYQWY